MAHVDPAIPLLKMSPSARVVLAQAVDPSSIAELPFLLYFPDLSRREYVDAAFGVLLGRARILPLQVLLDQTEGTWRWCRATHGLTARLTVMVCGLLLAPDAVMVTVPMCAPMAGIGDT